MTFGVDRRTGARLDPGVPETSLTELEAMLGDAAATASAYAATTPGRREEILRALADALDGGADRLIETAVAETGLTRERLEGELARTTSQLRFLGEVAVDGAFLDVVVDTRADMRSWLVPVGPVLVYAASNFPFAFGVLGGDTASALACGAPVVVKAHPSHPRTSVELVTLARRAFDSVGAPAQLLSLVVGDARGVQALQDPRIRACGFTGSTSGGRFLFDIAASRPEPIPFFGELGSVNPVVVTPGAVTARGATLVREFLGSVTGSAGQLCTKPGLLLLPVGHGLEAELAEVAALPSQPMLNDRIAGALAVGRSELEQSGARLIAQGHPPVADVGWAAPSLYRATTAWVRENLDIADRECFGPVALVAEYSDDADLLGTLPLLSGSLTGSVHAEEHEQQLASALVQHFAAGAGRVIYNGWPTGVAVGWATHHGGPWPASTSGHTSVGASSIRRWMRQVCYQGVPQPLLPEALTDADPWRAPRRVDGVSHR